MKSDWQAEAGSQKDSHISVTYYYWEVFKYCEDWEDGSTGE